MNLEELIQELKKIVDHQDSRAEHGRSKDCEECHLEADNLILEYIGNEEVKRIFESIEKWYS